MDTRKGQAEKTVRDFLDAYLIHRNIKNALSFLSDNIMWSGVGNDIALCGIQKVEKLLEKEFSRDPEPYIIDLIQPCETSDSLNHAVFMSELKLMRPVPAGPSYTLKARLSASCAQSDHVWKITSLHVSDPRILQDSTSVTNDYIEEEHLNHSVFFTADHEKQAVLQNHRLSAQLEARNEILKVALEHTSICEFYYYPESRSCVIPQRTCDYYHCNGRYDRMPDSFLEHLVLPSYHAVCRRMYDAIHLGSRTSNSEFLTSTGIWCRVIMSTVSWDENGKPDFVVGIIEDITNEKDMASALEKARSRDSMTGLWNKETGTRLAQEYMQSKPDDENCVIMLLDMDDFSRLNEEEGTTFANAVLLEVADILRAATVEQDLQIRLGGDEFMLFIKNCDKKQATIIGPHIAEQVQNLLAQTDSSTPISVSIGMCSTEVVNEYSGLYRCAESTLKYVKENCRGRAACYLDTSNELGVMLTNLYTEKYIVNTIEQEDTERGENLISFALDLLGKASNLEDAVSLLFARMGKIYHLDRVSLLEIDPAFLTCHFTYQWARDKSLLHLNKPIYITKENYDAAASCYGPDGLCGLCPNKEISPFPSCLHAGIWNHGAYIGALGFEVSQENYTWTKEQRRVLAEMGKIVPSFVMKARADAFSQAKTDFLSRMSHEIRTPMNAIVGMTAIARSMAGDREKVLECLDKLDTSNQYLLNLVNDILDMSRIESGKMELNPETIDLAALISSLEGMMRPQAEGKNLSLDIINECENNRPILADKLRLEQVLLNIVGNAVKFTEPGGRIMLRVTPVQEDTNNLTLHFSISDTGIGIAPEALQNIFNAFEQAAKDTSSRYGGTGLGLAISSRLVQMMGGILKVNSEPGHGSEFYFTLSFSYSDSLPVVKKHLEDLRSDSFKGKRLLIVEDNELNREIAQTLLEMNGFIVETSENGQTAIQCFAAHDAFYYDAILMDIHMPVMDGIEATKRLRTMGRDDSRTIPIIAMTANAFSEDSRKSLQIGMNGHLSKPIQMEELLLTLHQCLNC
ncbi:ATP-binding protein [[Clostridium] symbiosum]|uniref:ATP-binding protein n=1 Tax=Clostridium symbiosum TaxID=1512 RepID=UPI001D06610E|nr:ATP-binding protein [[Clostridium] symbiosum]MCB6610702.1 response regulator [[Clostridium] symbiosum]MCB6931312.1 response regulator [[Clostridium] symbiosum]